MFDVSLGEILTVALIALLVLGPEELPGVLRSIGKYLGKFRKYTADIRKTVEEYVLSDDDKDQPKISTSFVIGDDGKKYLAYNVDEVFDCIGRAHAAPISIPFRP